MDSEQTEQAQKPFTNTSVTLLENWKREVLRDKVINKMLGKNYDEHEFLLEVVKNHSMPQLFQIQQNMNQIKQNLVHSLDSTLQNNYVELIQDMENLKDVDVNIEECRDQMFIINKKIHNNFSQFTQQYELLQKKIPLLKNSYSAIFLTQNSIKFVQHFKILKTLVSSKFEVLDFVKTSQILNEISKLCKAVDFSGLQFFEQSKDFLRQAREATIQKTEKKFDQALQTKNQIEISNSIQIFYNLGILAETLQSRANNYLKNTRQIWKNALTKNYNQSNIIQTMSNTLKENIKEMHNNSLQIWLLNQSIKTSRDPKTLESYEEFLKGKNLLNIFDLFWNKQCQILQQSIINLKESKQKLSQNWACLLLIYPKLEFFLLNFVNNLHEQILSFPDHLQSYDITAIKEKMLNTISSVSPQYYEDLQKNLKQLFHDLTQQYLTPPNKLPQIKNFQNLSDFFINHSPNQFQILDPQGNKSSIFYLNRNFWETWENILIQTLYIFSIVTIFQVETQNKSQELISYQIEAITNILDKVSQKNSKTINLLVNIHKLFILDVESAQQIIERDSELKKHMGIYLFNFAFKLIKNLTDNQQVDLQLINSKIKEINNIETLINYLLPQNFINQQQQNDTDKNQFDDITNLNSQLLKISELYLESLKKLETEKQIYETPEFKFISNFFSDNQNY
ncbi:hypothetical protein PPERSA_11000 [Pseudocohnilembus persalinus]|uniref:Conserved oligomeric Golgi complex subunit 5 helical domain-containing protein n=1 Tax=Pseudocohnilembus persalinus TaxID=266149 RepID=A0A0V0QYY4_PSEPJ|nr:hypothetical protein PPERSA_11000 [Pseudocohnilembus persalinus]|eukprot:KRX07451.1 hypothetical protein PPERSA_11000 [Pseudocohnilembus persalinus]